MADVSGKGVPAAFFMLVSRTLLKGTAIGESDPAKCLEEVNRLLGEENKEAMFVTVFYAKFDPATGQAIYANAGHNLPFVVKASGEVQQLVCDSGLVLGVVPSFDFPSGSVHLDPGDAIFLYTDGVTEAMDENSVEFGEEKLDGVLAECAGSSAEAINHHVVKAVQEHAGEAP